MKNRAYNKKIHTKMTILQKSTKKKLFSLKIALQASNFGVFSSFAKN